MLDSNQNNLIDQFYRTKRCVSQKTKKKKKTTRKTKKRNKKKQEKLRNKNQTQKTK